jgi:hypothetical protein
MKTGFQSAYGCELPDNNAQRGVFEEARHRLGLDQQTTNGPSDWIGSDVLELNVPIHLRYLIIAVFCFWNGLDASASQLTCLGPLSFKSGVIKTEKTQKIESC